jgi:hypothetical protein
MRDYLKVEIEEKRQEIACLKCADQYKHTLISQNDIFKIAPEMIDIMMNNSLASVIDESNDMKYCIRRNCDGIGSLSENNFFCGKCYLDICWYCKVASNFGHECVGEQKEKTEEEFKQLVQQGLL